MFKDLKRHNRETELRWDDEKKLAQWQQLNAHRFRYFDLFVPSWKGLKVLDLNCAAGFSSEFLARQGAVVVGTDPSSALIKTAQNHAQLRPLEIEYRPWIGESLPFDDSSFDIVMGVDVLEHVADVRKVISEIFRVLKPNGFLLFDGINRTFFAKMKMIWLLEYIIGELTLGSHDWRKFVKPEELHHLLTQHGFGEITFKGFDIRGKNRKTGELKIVLNDSLSVQYVGKCVKQPTSF
ncbi:MAG: bifunctional 2-polyprenyl-6-hydroxyphenol methylase/3-demethylubiquinol 3-O-methyltransferase UbiG [Myxococcota bacterium]